MPPELVLIAPQKVLRGARLAEGKGKYRCLPPLLLFLLFALSSCSSEEKFKGYPVFYDFVENFPLAEVQQEVTLIDFGTPAARPHMIHGWSHDEKSTKQDVTYVWSEGEKSVLEFFLAEARAIQVTFRCFPFRFPGSPAQTISIEINGKSNGRIILEPELREYRITLPQHALLPGKNRLEFHYAYARATIDVIPDAKGSRLLGVAWDYIRLASSAKEQHSEPQANAESKVLFIPFGAQVDYYLKLSGESFLTLGGLTLAGNSPGRLSLILQREGEEEQILEDLQASEKFRAIQLPGDSPHIVRVSFRAVGLNEASVGSGVATVIRPTLRAKQLPDQTADEVSSRHLQLAEIPRRSNVIIYLIDALRADHLGCYGYEKPISPNIDAFAEDATLFENAIAQSPWTRASVASIFTGLSPMTHGANDRKDTLSAEAITLAEILRASGYHTAALIHNGNVGELFGFSQGFADFAEVPKNQFNKKISAWLEIEDGHQHPFFLYVHRLDPHAPYAPLGSFRERFASAVKQPEVGSRASLNRLRAKETPATKNNIEDLLSLYDAEIAFSDHNFGVLLKELQQRELYDETLIIFVSDHGEEFYEHEFWEHGRTLYAEVLNIPLIIKLPSSERTGKKKISPLGQHIDILPTILTYLGLEVPDQVEGQSLLPFLLTSEEYKPPRRAFSHLELDGRRATSIMDGPWKLIRKWSSRRLDYIFELYNHEQDPGEKVNLIEKHPVLAGYLLSVIKSHERSRRGRLKPGKAVINEDLRRQLKALGYVQ